MLRGSFQPHARAEGGMSARCAERTPSRSLPIAPASSEPAPCAATKRLIQRSEKAPNAVASS